MTNKKSYILQHIFVLLLLWCSLPTYNATVVYNLRIAETSKRQALEKKYKKPTVFAVALVSQFSKLHDSTRQDYTSGLATINYSTEHAYIHADFAVGNVRSKTSERSFSRTQMDDILITAGYGFVLSDRTRITFSGMVGIPTHKDVRPEGVQFGTGHVSIGAQMDGAFYYAARHNHGIFAAARYLHFFPRSIDVPIPPTNQIQQFDFNIGNVIDLFISHSSRWHRHRLEVGYNPTFIFGASSTPNLETLIEQSKGIISSFFGSYRYVFRIGTLPSGVGCGFSYGFNHSSKDFAQKWIVTLWAGWGINF